MVKDGLAKVGEVKEPKKNPPKEHATTKKTKAARAAAAVSEDGEDKLEKLLSLLGKPYVFAVRGTPEEEKAMNLELYGTETVPPPRQHPWDQDKVNKLMNEGG